MDDWKLKARAVVKLEKEHERFVYSQCCQGFETTMREIYPHPSIGVGHGWQVPPPNKKNLENILFRQLLRKILAFC